jgi:hypothetical protein
VKVSPQDEKRPGEKQAPSEAGGPLLGAQQGEEKDK